MTPGLYRLRGADGTLLYIGASRDPLGRFRQHCWTRGEDIRQVATFDVEWFDSFDAARKAEVAAIKAENPLWNIAHKEAA